MQDNAGQEQDSRPVDLDSSLAFKWREVRGAVFAVGLVGVAQRYRIDTQIDFAAAERRIEFQRHRVVEVVIEDHGRGSETQGKESGFDAAFGLLVAEDELRPPIS